MDHVVDFSVGDVVKVHSSQLDEFEKIVSANDTKKRYRLCLHNTPENELQEMLICTGGGTTLDLTSITICLKHIRSSEVGRQ